jgi:hypothetical protein
VFSEVENRKIGWIFIASNCLLFSDKKLTHFFQNGAVSIVIRLRAGQPRIAFRFPVKVGDFFSSTTEVPDWLWSKPRFLFNVYCGFFPGVKQAAREADHINSIWFQGYELRHKFIAPYAFMSCIVTILLNPFQNYRLNIFSILHTILFGGRREGGGGGEHAKVFP